MRGAYTWINTEVEEKVGLSARRPIRGGGAYRRRNTVGQERIKGGHASFRCHSV